MGKRIEVLDWFMNDDGGLEAIVWENDGGTYSVLLRDLDTEATVDVSPNIAKLEDARELARKWARLDVETRAAS